MNCVLWSMGDASLHGMGTSSGARQCGVTHVPGLKCYLCLRTVPRTVEQRSPADALRAPPSASVSVMSTALNRATLRDKIAVCTWATLCLCTLCLSIVACADGRPNIDTARADFRQRYPTRLCSKSA